MLATAIPPTEWKAFVDEFSRQHRGWLVTVEVIDTRLLDLNPSQADVAGPTLARDRPLQEVAVEEPSGATRVRIVVGRKPDPFVYRVRHPLGIRFEKTDDGAHQGVRIDDADGSTLRVRFRRPAHPEVLNGIGEAEW